MGEVIRKIKGGKFVGWYLRFIDADGRRKQRASKQPSHAEARRMLVEIEARIARGMVGIEAKSPHETLTLEGLFARFIAEYRNPRCKDVSAYREQTAGQLQRVSREAPQLARLSISALSAAHFAKVRDALSARYQSGTVRTTLSAVAAALAWAVREGLLVKSPAVGVWRPLPPEVRMDFLSADEIGRLLAEAERKARETPGARGLLWWSRWMAISIGIYTGARKGEIFGLRWSEVDLEGQRLTISRSYATTPKSGKTRYLRLPSVLAPLLREWKAHCLSPLVCPVLHLGTWGMTLSKNCEHGLTELLRAAGCRVLPRPWHLLRHTFASHFMQSGGSLLALSQILGHSDVKVTMVYAHLGKEFLDGEMDRLRFK